MSENTRIAPDVLYKLYVDDKLSKSEIAHKLGVSYHQVGYRLCKLMIPMRKPRLAISASRQLISCPVCGKQFGVIPTRIKRSKVICCSRECWWELGAIRLQEGCKKYLAEHPQVEKVCQVCGRSFSTNFYRRHRRKYCSAKCSGIATVLNRGRQSKPTKPEQTIIDIVRKYFPQFKYNGIGNLNTTLAGQVPDFVNVNGKKQVIEVFGNYWHTTLARAWKDTELGKRMAYNSVGYDCLVLWENEIKSKSEQELVEIIGGFASKRHKKKEVICANL